MTTKTPARCASKPAAVRGLVELVENVEQEADEATRDAGAGKAETDDGEAYITLED